MKVNVSSGGKTMEDTPCTFDEAMYLMEHQDTFYEDRENYLTFTAPEHSDGVLQFIRETEDRWVVDIPAFENGEYIGSYNTIANHSQTVAMISHFYIRESAIRQAIVKQNYSSLEEVISQNWGLGIHLVPQEE